MKAVFVDTSAWLALINKTDHLHHRARGVRDDLLEKQFCAFTSDHHFEQAGFNILIKD
jgi:predicted nucleic acid-binding protein